MNREPLPIIMTSMSRHDHLSSASLSLAKILSKSRRVFYINNPYTIKDRINRRIKGEIIRYSNEYDNLLIVEPKKVLPINFLPRGLIYRCFLKINDHIFFQAFKKIVDFQNIKPHEFIFFNSFNPFYGFLILKKFKPTLFLYQSRDDISSAPYISKHGENLEIDWIKMADLTYATGSALTKKLTQKSGVIVKHLPNAANTSFFETYFNDRVPESNIIGYLGEVETRVDLRLLEEVANYLPNHLILVIGPCWNSIIEDFRKKCPNVVFVGFREYKQIPSLISKFRCAIIPFVKNELTRNIYPLKINEYLACGLPVVSTDFSPDLESFKSVVYISSNKDEFKTLINKAISEDNSSKRKERKEFARKNNWFCRSQQLLKDVDKLIQNSYNE